MLNDSTNRMLPGLFKSIIIFVFLLVTGIILSLTGRQISREAAAMNNIPVISAAALQDSQPGRTVFVEGLISPSNRTMYHDWVAYIREDGTERREYVTSTPRRSSWDNETSFGAFDQGGSYEIRIEWRETEKVLPPLLINTKSGLVQIEDPAGGNGYSLENRAGWSSEGNLRRYTGLKVNNQVVALGQIQSGNQGHYLDARMIARGTRNEYLVEQQRTARYISFISIPFFVIGLLGLAGTLIRLVYRFGYSNN